MGAGVDIDIGEVVAGRYEVVRVIGEGGMGTVYEVVDQKTRRRRALKVMQASVVANHELRARFEREAVVAAEVVSDHIAEVFDAGVDNDRGLPFIVLELLEGEELGEMIEPSLRLTPTEVVTYLGQAAIALDKAHEKGIVHRDLKPENLYVTRRDDGSPRVKLLDFGIAKVVAQTQAGPQTQGILGTPLYMAPEQMHGEHDIGPATDTYALAHIAYRLLVGEAFWAREQANAETVYRFLMGVMKGTDESASARAKTRAGIELPAAFDGWFARATAPNPKDRFQTAGDLAATLGAIFDVTVPGVDERGSMPFIDPPTFSAPAKPGKTLAQAPAVTSAQPSGSTQNQGPMLSLPASSSATTTAGTSREDVEEPPSKPPLLAIGIGLMALAGIGAFFATRAAQSDPDPPPVALEDDGDRKPASTPSSARPPPKPDAPSPPSTAGKPGGEPPKPSGSDAAPPKPDLTGLWKLKDGRGFRAEWHDGAWVFIIPDGGPYARQGYKTGESRFVLHPDGDGYLVEEYVRPEPATTMRYPSNPPGSCLMIAKTDSAGTPLRARLTGEVLRVEVLRFKAQPSAFVAPGGVVERCDFSALKTSITSATLRR